MHYSLLGRDVERDVISMMRRYGLGMTVWSPLASGFLSGKYTGDTLSDPDNRYAGFDILPFDKEHGFTVVQRLHLIAKTYDASVAQVGELDAATPLMPVYPNWFVDQMADQPVTQALEADPVPTDV